MDMNSVAAQTTTVAENAGKSGLHLLWTYAAVHPRSAVIVSAILILASGVIGFAIGVGA